MSPTLPPLLRRILAPGGDDRLAVAGAGTAATFAELRRHVESLRAALERAGIGCGDRVAVCLPKTVATVETILGILAAGAAYVPLSHRLGVTQLRRLLEDLKPCLLIAERELAAQLRRSAPDFAPSSTVRIAVPADRSATLEFVDEVPGELAIPASPADLAAILYTSGSTGEPKGIMLTHRNIESFVDWAAQAFAVSEQDRLANHAPFTFDLSIFDLFCGLSRHARVHLIDETTARFPGSVRNLIEGAGITIWYSVPTALARLQERRALRNLDCLRAVLFAGEVFPVPVLRQLMRDAPAPEYVNLYGPTETNVCTYYRLPGPPDAEFEPLPIGWPCEHLDVRILDPEGSPVRPGEPGEICVAGPAVMQGYWDRDGVAGAPSTGRKGFYRTGDFAYARRDGAFMFAGRRDQQIKVRGHRVELLAIESVLNAHPQVREAAALFICDPRRGGSLAAFLVAKDRPVPAADIRAFIAERLPPQYQPDQLEWLAELPKTANGKCDRVRLTAADRHAVGS
jgi:amino acid adenylation domain-containing protein